MNIILDPLFIFAFHLGVRGAALATILSQAVSCIWVLSFLCGKKDDPTHPEKESHPETGNYSSLCRSRACHIYHAG